MRNGRAGPDVLVARFDVPGIMRRSSAHRRGLNRSPRRRTILWGLGGVAALVVVLGVLAGVQLMGVAGDLRHARRILDDAGQKVEAGQLTTARTELNNARRLLTRANSGLYGKITLDLVGVLPVARQNLDALRDTVAVALRMADGGERILAITQPFENSAGRLEVPMRGGSVPLPAITSLQSEAAALAAVLPRQMPHRSSLLFGAIANAQDRAYKEAVRRARQLDSVSRGLALLQDMSGGSGARRYLIAVANTAEMRGAGGMMLSYGTLSGQGGTFTLGDFGSIDDLRLDGPVPPDSFTAAGIKVPPDYLVRWAPQQPTELWRNTTLAPDFAFDARMMGVMYQAKTGLKIDGVIQIDPAGLAAILKGIGPVDVPSVGTVTAENVVDLTLNRAYTEFPNRDQRQEVLGDVAKSTFKALVSGQYGTLRPLGAALHDAAVTRHVIFYAASATTQAVARSFDATGSLPAANTQDYAMLTVQNFSKNKLDYYLDSSLSLSGSRVGGQPGSLTAAISLTNTVPPGLNSTYVTGPNASGEQAGLYRGVVSLYLPPGTSIARSTGDATSTAPAVTTEAGRTVVTFGIDVPAQATRAVTLQLTLAPRPAKVRYSLTLVPVPRVRPTTVSVDLDVGGQVVRRQGPLERLEVLTATQQMP